MFPSMSIDISGILEDPQPCPEMTTAHLCKSISLIPAGTDNFGRAPYQFVSCRRYRWTSSAIVLHAPEMPTLAIQPAHTHTWAGLDMELTPEGHAGRLSGSPTGTTLCQPLVNCSTNPGDTSSFALILRVGYARTRQFHVSSCKNTANITIISRGQGLQAYNPPKPGYKTPFGPKNIQGWEGGKVLRKGVVHHIAAEPGRSCTTSNAMY